MTASSSGWTPLFLNDEPHSTGVSLISSVALRIACVEAARPGSRLLLEDQLDELVVVVRDLLEQVLARGRGLVGHVGSGMSTISTSLPRSSL